MGVLLEGMVGEECWEETPYKTEIHSETRKFCLNYPDLLLQGALQVAGGIRSPEPWQTTPSQSPTKCEL